MAGQLSFSSNLTSLTPHLTSLPRMLDTLIILRVEAKEVTPDDMIRTSEDVRNRFDERLQQVPVMVDGEHRLIRFNFGHQPNMQQT